MKDSAGQPLLSVIIPVYNGEQYLRATVESVLKASYQNIELLLVDDGSSDSSSIICIAYTQIERRVRYFRKENGGIVSARNRGLSEARGDYICFCDQDDIVDCMMYERLMEKILSKNADIGICSTGRLINGEKTPYEMISDGIYEGNQVKEKLLYPILFRGYDYPFLESESYLYGTIWKCIFDRKFLMENDFSFKRFIDYEDDWIFLTEVLCTAQKAVTDSYTGYYWRVLDESQSHDGHFVENITEKMKNFDEYVLKYLKNAITDNDIFEEYVKVNFCEHFIRLYRNDVGSEAQDAEKREKYHAQVSEYMKSVQYKDKLDCLNHLKKGLFRRRAVLTSLKYIGIEVTFYVSKTVDWMENTLGSVNWIVELERRLKG